MNLQNLKNQLHLNAMKSENNNVTGLLLEAHDTIIKLEEAMKYVRSISVHERAYPTGLAMTALSLITKECNKYLDEVYDVGPDGIPFAREKKESDQTI